MRRDLLAKSLSQLNEEPSPSEALAQAPSPIVEEKTKTPSGQVLTSHVQCIEPGLFPSRSNGGYT